MGRRSKARECALQMLYQWDVTQDAVDDVTEAFSLVRPMTERTREMAERLFRGALRDSPNVDRTIVATAAHWRIDRLAVIERCILRLAVYELLNESQTPAAVVIDEAVELAKRFGAENSGAFVNGVLDTIRRECRADEPSPSRDRCRKPRAPGAPKRRDERA